MPSSTAATPAPPLKIALIGNPNTGKSTLFNALSGGQARIGNYPGVTVEKKIGTVRWAEQIVQLIDLPGTYSLAPRSLDEVVSVDVLLGRQEDVGRPDAVICIVDASNLERNLYLVSQVLDLGLPAVLVVNMWDVAQARGITLDPAALEQRLGLPVVLTSAHRKQGITEIRAAVERAIARGPIPRPPVFPAAFAEECTRLGQQFAAWGQPDLPLYLQERLLLDVGGSLEAKLANGRGSELAAYLQAARDRLAAAGCRVPAIESRVRYAWAKQMLAGIVTRPAQRPVTWSDRIDRWLTHRVTGLIAFCLVMFIIFQALYAWAEPLMAACEAGQGFLTGLVSSALPPGPLRSLINDGVIAGVGGVLIFLPQIVLLFLFIAILEDCGYMARAAFLMDKLMTKVGLSGKSFVPLMSSFACAIPGVMATRVIENRRDRMVTLLVAPLMSCSARLPVYILLIGAFIPRTSYLGGWIGLRGLVLFAMIALGAVVAIPVAWILKKTLFRGETPPFVMELPSYKVPSLWIVFRRVYDQGAAFVTRAGTLIFATTILVWAAGYFPGDHRPADQLQAKLEQEEPKYEAPLKEKGELEEREGEIEVTLDPEPSPTRALGKLFGYGELTAAEAEALKTEQAEIKTRLAELDGELQPLTTEVEKLNIENERLLEGSLLGQGGKVIEPAVRPLGWDWKIGVGVIASFPAREVIVATLGTIYSLGGDVGETDQGLRDAMRSSTWADTGKPVYNVPVALSVMVFFALCAQCASTLMVIGRETNSWRWPIFTFVYMTALAYVAALITYQVGRLWL